MFAASIRCSARQFSSLNPTTSSGSKFLSPQKIPQFHGWTFRRNIRQRPPKNGIGAKERSGEHVPEHIVKQFEVSADRTKSLRKPMIFTFGVILICFQLKFDFNFII